MVELHYLGHSCFKISSRGKSVLIDPVLDFNAPSKDFECVCPPKVKPSDLKNITLILITHEHFDHFEKETVERIAKESNACVVAHPHVLQEFEGHHISKAFLHPISLGQKLLLRDIGVEALPAHHPQAFYPLGYLVSMNGTRVYHAGDTDLLDEMAKIKTDIALLPIGGHETMDCVDAVRAVKTMKPKVAIPMHYNTFKMIQQDPREFKQKIDKSILDTEVVLLQPGKKFRYK